MQHYSSFSTTQYYTQAVFRVQEELFWGCYGLRVTIRMHEKTHDLPRCSSQLMGELDLATNALLWNTSVRLLMTSDCFFTAHIVDILLCCGNDRMMSEKNQASVLLTAKLNKWVRFLLVIAAVTQLWLTLCGDLDCAVAGPCVCRIWFLKCRSVGTEMLCRRLNRFLF